MLMDNASIEHLWDSNGLFRCHVMQCPASLAVTADAGVVSGSGVTDHYAYSLRVFLLHSMRLL